MSTLYLTCGLCGRKQADGILSRSAWGHADAGSQTLRACPTCKAQNPNWEAKLLNGSASASGQVLGSVG